MCAVGFADWPSGMRCSCRDLDEPSAPEQIGEPPSVLRWHEAVFGGPDHEYRTVEKESATGGDEYVALASPCP
jgi:hypothetical protein